MKNVGKHKIITIPHTAKRATLKKILSDVFIFFTPTALGFLVCLGRRELLGTLKVKSWANDYFNPGATHSACETFSF
ncbi:MAG: hypothetical protein LBT05_05630 [Planctomycetaceae bacterium]|jgi:hypothetical protein|nr:hypothetical protein [Planctomycetaceae bacterium]